ncbi:glycosyl transferase [Micractinium conductrix]|uniref:Glycosyl transferase n=1 Tax=Micractinium conductrix TaxID=554055 RepID=A0A2P6VQX4_9CHLO|nr:glycosyl transferase [Micractinium conductrix]|eukprot:PSC76477.1 glycosyl transferase [Micractinium conductrix]
MGALKVHRQRLRAHGGLVAIVGVGALLLLAARLSWGDLAHRVAQRRGGVRKAGVQRIPRILHHAYLSGREAFQGLSSDPSSAMRPEWAQWCEALHDGWEYRFWDEAAAVQLLEEHYPWFLPTWRGYKQIVEKGDAIRYFIMHRYGGVYYDLDVECFRKGDDMLVGADVVLQGTGGQEGVTNAMLASVPGHPLWKCIFKLLQERQGKWVIEATGPSLVRDAALDLQAVPNTFVGLHKWKGTLVRVWPLGEWTTPCWASDRKCHQNMALQRAAGMFKPKLVAYHRYTGSWLNMDNAAHFLTHGGLDGRLFGTAEVQDAVAETIDDRPASRVSGRVEDSVLRIACPRPGWRITAVHSALYGMQPAAQQGEQQQQQQQDEEEEEAAAEDGGQEGEEGEDGPQQPTKKCKSSSAFAAVAAACLGRWRCFLRVDPRALGPAPCADRGAADLTLEAAVVCSPPRMVKDTQQPLAPELREQLKWRKSHQLEVPALAALGKPVTITCPASDWSMTNVAPANSTQPSPVAAAIHELCLGRAECSLAVGGGGVRDTLLTLGAKLRVNGTSVQSQGALGGAVTSLDDNSLSAIFRALGRRDSGPTVTCVCKRWRQVFLTESAFYRDVGAAALAAAGSTWVLLLPAPAAQPATARPPSSRGSQVELELPLGCVKVAGYLYGLLRFETSPADADAWSAGKAALLSGCSAVAACVSVRGVDLMDAVGAASPGCWTAADLLHALQPAVLRSVSLQASGQAPGSALQALRRFTQLEALQLDCCELPRNAPAVLRCLRPQLTSLCLHTQQPAAGCVDALLQLRRLCSLELACAVPHFQMMGATLHSAQFTPAGSSDSSIAAVSLEGAMLDPRKSPSLLQLLPALLPGAAAGGALSLRLRSCTLPLHSLLVGTAPAPVRSLLLEQCRFPGGGPAVDVLLKQLPALSSLSFVSDPERDGAAQLDWVPGDITWRSGLTHLALVGQRINTLPPGRYLDRLVELDLSCCAFARLPLALSAATSLTSLKLGGNLDLKLSAADVATGLLPLVARLRQLHLWGCGAPQSALAALFSAAPALNADAAAWPGADWCDDECSDAASGETGSGEQSSGEVGSGEHIDGEHIDGECSDGECSSGERLTGEASSGEASSDEAPSDSSSSSSSGPSSVPSAHSGDPSSVPSSPSAHSGDPSSAPSSPSAHSGDPSSVPSSPSAHSGDPSSAPSSPSAHSGDPSAVPSSASAHSGDPSAVPSSASAPPSTSSQRGDGEYGMGSSSDGGSAGGMGSSSSGSDGMPSASAGTGSGNGDDGAGSDGGVHSDADDSGGMRSTGGSRKVSRKLSF